MADRPTHKIETPTQKVEVELFDYLTGGDKRRLMAEPEEGNRVKILVTSLVKSVGGKNEDVVASLDELHGKDFDFVLLELGKIAEASSLSEQKKRD